MSFAEKRLDVKSPRGFSRAEDREELETRCPKLLSLREPIAPYMQGSLGLAVSQSFLMQNLLLKTPYKFKKSYVNNISRHRRHVDK